MVAFVAGSFYHRMGSIEKKLDTFITKDVIDEKQRAADQEHYAIRREINGVTSRINAIEERD